MKLSDKIFLLGLCHSSVSLKKHKLLETSSLSIYRHRSTQPDWPLRSSYSHSLGTTETL